MARGRSRGRPKNSTLSALSIEDDPFGFLSSTLEQSVKNPNIYSYKPHNKQLAFHESTAKVRLFIGGNRSGKTHGAVAEDIYWLRGNHPYRPIPDKQITGRVIGVDFINGVEKIIIPKFKQLLPPSLLINGSWEDSWSKQLRTLNLSNGNSVEFMSYDQDVDKFAGTSRDFIHFDEEPPQSIFNENRARLVDVNGDAWLSMTPLDGFTWTYEDLYLKGLDPDETAYFVVEVNTHENTAVPPEALQLFLDSLPEEEKLAREKGQYMSVGGKIYKEFDPVKHVVPYDLEKIKNLIRQGWSLYESVDHGWNNPTAWEFAIVSPKNMPLEIIVIDEHYRSEMTIDVHATEVFRKRGLYGLPYVTTGDPAMKQSSAINGISIIDEYARHGIYIGVEGVPKGPGSVGVGVEKLNKLLKPNPLLGGRPTLTIMDSCPNLVKQMGMLRWKTFEGKAKDKNNKTEEIQKKDDHAPDSLRYMVTVMPELQTETDNRPDRVNGFLKTNDPWEGKNVDRNLIPKSGHLNSDGSYFAVPTVDAEEWNWS